MSQQSNLGPSLRDCLTDWVTLCAAAPPSSAAQAFLGRRVVDALLARGLKRSGRCPPSRTLVTSAQFSTAWFGSTPICVIPARSAPRSKAPMPQSNSVSLYVENRGANFQAIHVEGCWRPGTGCR